MEEETPQTSLWSEVLATYRDVELAKRQQPKLVQGAQQIQVPLSQNVSAPQQPVSIGSGAGSVINSPMFSKYLLFGSLGLLALGVGLKLAKS